MINSRKHRLQVIKNWIISIIVIAIFVWAFAGIQFNGFQKLAQQVSASVWQGITHPEWEFISAPFDRFVNSTLHIPVDDLYLDMDGEDLISKLIDTIGIAILGTFISALLAVPFAFLAARTNKGLKNGELKVRMIAYSGIFFGTLIILAFIFGGFKINFWVTFWFWLFIIEAILIVFDFLINKAIKHRAVDTKSITGKVILTFIRVFPEIILALMFVKAVGPGSFAGVLALAVHSIGMLGKLFSESIENLETGSNEAITAAGGDKIQVLTFSTLPTVLPDFLNATLYRLEIAVRSASILGMVGAGGIGQDLIMSTQVRNWPRAGIILFGVIIMVTLIDIISGQLRKRII